MSLRPLIAGNWKMNGRLAEVAPYAATLARLSGGRSCDLLVCPPAPLAAAMAAALEGSGIAVGGQDCHTAAKGAHTGDVAAEQLADVGCSHVIVGHSERRTDHGETDLVVRAKAEAALNAGLVPIVCVGETLAQRKAGQAAAVVRAQFDGSVPRSGAYVLAYEPVWAIGTGLTPSSQEIAEMHATLRSLAGAAVRLLYGGSVKPSNAVEILAIADVDGALVGGASLKAEEFWAIAEAVGP